MKTLYERLVESLPDMNNTDTKKSDRKAKMKYIRKKTNVI